MILPGKEEITTPKDNKQTRTDSVSEALEKSYSEPEEKKLSVPEAVPDTQPEKPKLPINRPGGSTPSIKDALNSLNTTEDSKTDEQDVDNTPDINLSAEELEITSINQEELIECWNKYVEKFKSDSPRIFNALSNQDLILQDDGTTLQLSFRNSAQLAEFKQNFKIPLLSYLREGLNTNTLEITEIIPDMEDNSQARHYTDIDKLKHMIEKNPAIQKLKKDFNLDFE